LLIWEPVMKPEFHRVATLPVASIAALCLLATPLAIDRNTLAIDSAQALANDLRDAANSVGDSLGDAANSVGHSVGNAANHVSDSVGSAANHVGDSVGNAANHVSDSVGNAADSVGDSVGNAADGVDHSIEDTADNVGASADTGVTVIVRKFTKIAWEPGRGSREAGDRRLSPERGSFSATTVAAIEPSAGLVIPDCANEQGAETPCLNAGTRSRQITYAPHDKQIYRLQHVEARRYSDGDMPILVVQGLLSNTSNGERSVPSLLAIAQDDQGKELMRWTFSAEVESLGPGASSGFRSEMIDPKSEAAKVTIVIAPERRARW
jgi:ribosomal protein S6E (S10)